LIPPKNILFLTFLITAVFSFAQKTDTLVMMNGNIVTGEIKELDYGLLIYKTAGMGTLKVKRENINSLKSKKRFEVLMDNGDIYYGSFDLCTSKPHTLKILFINGYDTFDIKHIVEVYPIRKNFWRKISGNFDMGFNYSKGSDIATVSLSGNILQKGKRINNNLKWDNLLTYTGDSLKSSKFDLYFSSERKIKNGWSLGALAGVNNSSELGLDLRVLFSFIATYNFIYNDRNRLFATMGPLVNMEWDKGNAVPAENFESILSAGYKFYKYSSPEMHIDTYITAFPNMKFNGRWRLSYNLNVNIEVVNNFYVGTVFFIDYDNKPSLEAVSTSDWGTTLTVGYSFN